MSDSIVTPGNIIAVGIVGGGLYFAYQTYQNFSLPKAAGDLGKSVATFGINAGETAWNKAVKPLAADAYKSAIKPAASTVNNKVVKPIANDVKKVDKKIGKYNPGDQLADATKKLFKKIF